MHLCSSSAASNWRQGFSTCMYAVYSEVSGLDSELFTTIHSLFSFFRGVAVVSVGPVGVSILQHSPGVTVDDYAIGKYKVSSASTCFGRENLHWK